MIYRHGSYDIPVRVVDVAFAPEVNSAGELIRSRKTIAIEATVRGATQADLSTAIANLEAAFLGTAVAKSGLVLDDGVTFSPHTLDASVVATESGIVPLVRWLDGPPEYVRKRTAQIVLTMIQLGPGADEFEYNNRIVRIGDGSPIYVPRLTFDGVVIQQAYPASPFFGVETGRKVSRLGFVSVPGPTYAALNLGSEQQTETGVDVGPDGVRRYFASWTYQYLSATAW